VPEKKVPGTVLTLLNVIKAVAIYIRGNQPLMFNTMELETRTKE